MAEVDPDADEEGEEGEDEGGIEVVEGFGCLEKGASGCQRILV